ncbi:MAG TPA: hypothetical protein PKA98_02115, partial [Acidimicrobiales bacterium]|nr:hypothetical protein [Acidimicrobiales bacterium]
RLWEGRAREALDIATAAVANFRRIEDVFGEVQALGPVGRALVALGRVDEGFAALEEMLAVRGITDDMRNLALTAVAGAAVHVGEPHRLPPELRDVGPDQFGRSAISNEEQLVALGLAALQRGEPDRALAYLEKAGVDGRRPPYPQSALALALERSGRGDEAIETADLALAAPGATYLDRSAARVAKALALAAQGDRAATVATLDEALAEVDATDDVVASAIVRLGEVEARSRLGEDVFDLAETVDLALDRLGLSAEGWRRAISG